MGRRADGSTAGAWRGVGSCLSVFMCFFFGGSETDPSSRGWVVELVPRELFGGPRMASLEAILAQGKHRAQAASAL